MTRRVSFHADAVAEVEAAAAWYDEQHVGLGLQFLAAIDRVVEHVRQWPDTGSPMPATSADLNLRRSAVARFPYHLVYLHVESEIQVIAVAHALRRPGYWRDRPGRPKA